MIKVYEIPSSSVVKIKNILEAQEAPSGELAVEIEKEQGGGKFEKAKSWKVNEFKKQGYALRDAKTLDIDKKVFYLYIEAPEDFFKRNEKILIDNGAKILETGETESIRKKIDDAESNASSGVGFIFG
jgi:hypothetical protein